MPQEKDVKNLDSVDIVDFKVHARKSSKGNVFNGLYAYDENGKEYFVAFVNAK